MITKEDLKKAVNKNNTIVIAETIQQNMYYPDDTHTEEEFNEIIGYFLDGTRGDMMASLEDELYIGESDEHGVVDKSDAFYLIFSVHDDVDYFFSMNNHKNECKVRMATYNVHVESPKDDGKDFIRFDVDVRMIVISGLFPQVTVYFDAISPFSVNPKVSFPYVLTNEGLKRGDIKEFNSAFNICYNAPTQVEIYGLPNYSNLITYDNIDLMNGAHFDLTPKISAYVPDSYKNSKITVTKTGEKVYL